MSGRSVPEPRPEYGGAYDYLGAVAVDYAPEADGEPDPGEIVWTWVPYQEDPAIGKDRPMVVIGRAVDSPGDFVVLMLSSRDHTDDEGWVFLGAGAWDRDRRESWVRVDRLFAVGPKGIRSESVALKPERFLQLIVDANAELC